MADIDHTTYLAEVKRAMISMVGLFQNILMLLLSVNESLVTNDPVQSQAVLSMARILVFKYNRNRFPLINQLAQAFEAESAANYLLLSPSDLPKSHVEIVQLIVQAMTDIVRFAEFFSTVDLKAFDREYNGSLELVKQFITVYQAGELEDFGNIMELTRCEIETIGEKEHATTSENPSDWPPPLPQIRDQELENKVFRRIRTDPFYSEFESIGGNMFKAFLVVYLFNHKPHWDEDELASGVRFLTSEEYFGKWIRPYKLHRRFDRDESYLPAASSIFKVFLAALYRDQGREVVQEWLEKLVTIALPELENAPI